MEKKGLLILFIVAITIFSCKKTSINNSDGKLITYSSCKNDKSINSNNGETCVEYSYNAQNKTLNLKHINVAFNCCPDKLQCEISIKNDTIIIEENEKKSECSCMCLYDIETEAYNLEEKTYTVKYIEQYSSNYEKIIFNIDLSNKKTGSFCLERTYYPYNL